MAFFKGLHFQKFPIKMGSKCQALRGLRASWACLIAFTLFILPLKGSAGWIPATAWHAGSVKHGYLCRIAGEYTPRFRLSRLSASDKSIEYLSL